ncbi:hypothetical protein [Glutamicibacter sp.]|uniref:hypothetical protein n=1 Tax=Glutamicibacter sp. TaxID=1931995 RepID=UPI002B48D101|nr:hypothetical protein [Glutamicibacter sp.]HJX79711.1 hypothetical protein [Glutamicibacter sp.]
MKSTPEQSRPPLNKPSLLRHVFSSKTRYVPSSFISTEVSRGTIEAQRSTLDNGQWIYL